MLIKLPKFYKYGQKQEKIHFSNNVYHFLNNIASWDIVHNISINEYCPLKYFPLNTFLLFKQYKKIFSGFEVLNDTYI